MDPTQPLDQQVIAISIVLIATIIGFVIAKILINRAKKRSE